jgi:hypothetical protein
MHGKKEAADVNQRRDSHPFMDIFAGVRLISRSYSPPATCVALALIAPRCNKLIYRSGYQLGHSASELLSLVKVSCQGFLELRLADEEVQTEGDFEQERVEGDSSRNAFLDRCQL